jgi:nucleoside-diphosphate-sugar epimerase
MNNVLITGAGMVGVQIVKILHDSYGIKPVLLDLFFDYTFIDTVVDKSF